MIGINCCLSGNLYAFCVRDFFRFINSYCAPGDAAVFTSGVRQPCLLGEVQDAVYWIVGVCDTWVSERFSFIRGLKKKNPTFAASPPMSWTSLQSEFCETSGRQCIELYQFLVGCTPRGKRT
jgi:hypothetical protein